MRRPLLLATARVALVACTTACTTSHSVPSQHRSVATTCPAADVIPPDASSPAAAHETTCVTDSDCAGGGVCSCQGQTFGWAHVSPGNVCLPANCHVDTDCGPSGYCSPSLGQGGSFYGVQGYYCHTPQDSCANDSDCNTGGYCAYQPTVGAWACGYSHAAG